VNGRTLRRLWRVSWQTVVSYGKHENGMRAAALAYYSLLSLFPLLLLLIAIASRALTSSVAQEQVLAVVRRVAPMATDLVARNIKLVLAERGTISAVAAVGLAWSASSFFSALIHSLERVWTVEQGRAFWHHRLFSLALVFGVVVLFLVSLLLSVLLSLLPRLIASLLPFGAGLVLRGWQYVPSLIPMGLDVLVYVALYAFLPARRPPWPAVWAGGIVAGLGWGGLKVGFAWYLANFARYGLVYGTLSTLVAFLFWVYLSAVVLLLGAEFGAAWERVWLNGEGDPVSPRRANGPQDDAEEEERH